MQRKCILIPVQVPEAPRKPRPKRTGRQRCAAKSLEVAARTASASLSKWQRQDIGWRWWTRDTPKMLSSPLNPDYISTCFLVVETFDLFRAMFQHRTLIDIGLVGDFSCGQ